MRTGSPTTSANSVTYCSCSWTPSLFCKKIQSLLLKPPRLKLKEIRKPGMWNTPPPFTLSNSRIPGLHRQKRLLRMPERLAESAGFVSSYSSLSWPSLVLLSESPSAPNTIRCPLVVVLFSAAGDWTMIPICSMFMI